MKYSALWKFCGAITLLFFSLCTYAQVRMSDSIQFDALEKIIGVVFTLGGIFLGVMQLKMANKIAEVESRVQKVINEVEAKFNSKIETETDKLEAKISLSGKEIEARMATRHDIENLKTVMKLTGELAALSIEALKEQIKGLRYDK